jgi:hypothetical protein
LLAAHFDRMHYGPRGNEVLRRASRLADPKHTDWAMVRDGADVCDESVATVNGGTEKRYRCWGQALASDDPFDTLKSILSSCGGWFAHQSGVFRVWPGKYYAPVQGATLTPADFVGPVNLIERRSASERFGGVEGTFWSEEDGWREVSYPTVTLADAGDSPRLVSLPQPMTPSPYQAQRVAHMTLLRNGYGLRLDGVTNLKGLLIGAGDIPQLGFPDDGVSESAFWVTDWRLTEGEDGLLSVALSADQHTPAMYLPPVLQVYTPSQKPNMMRAGAGYPDPVTGLEAEWQFQEA